MKEILTKERKVTLYVKSIRTLVEKELEIERSVWLRLTVGGRGFSSMALGRPYPMHYVKIVGEYEFVLPEDQRKFIETVNEAADKLGFDVQIVDVGKENILRREIQKEIERIRIFPTLVTESGKKVEGTISKRQIEAILSKQKT